MSAKLPTCFPSTKSQGSTLLSPPKGHLESLTRSSKASSSLSHSRARIRLRNLSSSTASFADALRLTRVPRLAWQVLCFNACTHRSSFRLPFRATAVEKAFDDQILIDHPLSPGRDFFSLRPVARAILLSCCTRAHASSHSCSASLPDVPLNRLSQTRS